MTGKKFKKRTISFRFLLKNRFCNFLPTRPEIVALLQSIALETPVIRALHAAQHDVPGIYRFLKFRRLAVNEFGTAFNGDGEQRVTDGIDAAANAAARLEYGDIFSGCREAPRCSKTGSAGADDDYGLHIDLDPGPIRNVCS